MKIRIARKILKRYDGRYLQMMNIGCIEKAFYRCMKGKEGRRQLMYQEIILYRLRHRRSIDDMPEFYWQKRIWRKALTRNV